VQDLKLKDKS